MSRFKMNVMTRDEALYKLQAQCSLKEICISEAEDKLRKWKIDVADFLV